MLNLVLDNHQCEHRKIFQADDIKYENTEEMEMHISDNIIWQTAKESESYICQHTRFDLPRDTQQQQPEDGKRTHHSALVFSSQNKISKQLCKFQKNIKAWFTTAPPITDD